jgi:hypothetical protein
MVKVSAYSPLDSLVDLACRDGVDIRPTLLRVLTDLYVQKPIHSADEETQYVELALGLIEAVDAPTRAAVATRLAAYPSAPAAICSKLADFGAMPDPDAIAVAEPPLPSSQDLIELFFAAGAEERCLILTNLDAATEPAAHPSALASSETIRHLENAALRRNLGEFGRLLEPALGIDRALAERISRDDSGEPIVVAAKAVGMPAAVLQRILLVLNPAIGQSVGRVFDLADLFDALTPAAAARMLAIWQQAGSRAQARHQPLYWDDERRDARSLATAGRHRAVRPREQRPSRFTTYGR